MKQLDLSELQKVYEQFTEEDRHLCSTYPGLPGTIFVNPQDTLQRVLFAIALIYPAYDVICLTNTNDLSIDSTFLMRIESIAVVLSEYDIFYDSQPTSYLLNYRKRFMLIRDTVQPTIKSITTAINKLYQKEQLIVPEDCYPELIYLVQLTSPQAYADFTSKDLPFPPVFSEKPEDTKLTSGRVYLDSEKIPYTFIDMDTSVEGNDCFFWRLMHNDSSFIGLDYLRMASDWLIALPTTYICVDVPSLRSRMYVKKYSVPTHNVFGDPAGLYQAFVRATLEGKHFVFTDYQSTYAFTSELCKTAMLVGYPAFKQYQQLSTTPLEQLYILDAVPIASEDLEYARPFVLEHIDMHTTLSAVPFSVFKPYIIKARSRYLEDEFAPYEQGKLKPLADTYISTLDPLTAFDHSNQIHTLSGKVMYRGVEVDLARVTFMDPIAYLSKCYASDDLTNCKRAIALTERMLYRVLRVLEQVLSNFSEIYVLNDLAVFEYNDEIFIGVMHNAPTVDGTVVALGATQDTYKLTDKPFNLIGASEVYDIDKIMPMICDLLGKHPILARTEVTSLSTSEILCNAAVDAASVKPVLYSSYTYTNLTDSIYFRNLEKDNCAARRLLLDYLKTRITSYGLSLLDVDTTPLNIYGGLNSVPSASFYTAAMRHLPRRIE